MIRWIMGCSFRGDSDSHGLLSDYQFAGIEADSWPVSRPRQELNLFQHRQYVVIQLVQLLFIENLEAQAKRRRKF
jgi:hypothetical protein